MTPEQKHADAVDAAREWSALERERVPLPDVGELIAIVWPLAEHDFKMRFMYEDASMLGVYPGWHWLHGAIVEPENWYGRHWSFMAHLVDGEWTMLPRGGKLSDVEA